MTNKKTPIPLKNYDYLFSKITSYIFAEANRPAIDYPPRLYWKTINETDVKTSVISCPRSIFAKSLGLYINIPFCLRKCVFCCYPVHLSAQRLNDYFSALLKEISLYSELLGKTPFHSVFIGGGTPTLLNENQLNKLFSHLHKNFNLTQTAQFSLETDPSHLNEEKIRILKHGGVDRLGLGIQSLDKNVLQLNNRKQNTAHIKHIFNLAKKYDIKHMSLDLVAGIPGQTLETFMNSFDTILSWKPDTIHINQFKPTLKTPFTQKGGKLSSYEKKLIQLMNKQSLLTLKKLGYAPIGGHQRSLNPDARNIHLSDVVKLNSAFIGIGAYANGHITGAYRYSNHGDLDKYITEIDSGRLPIEKGAPMNTKEEVISHIISNLSTGKVLLKPIELLYKKNLDEFPEIMKKIKHLESRGKISIHKDCIQSHMNTIEECITFSQYLFSENMIRQSLKFAAQNHIPTNTPKNYTFNADEFSL